MYKDRGRNCNTNVPTWVLSSQQSPAKLNSLSNVGHYLIKD